MPQDEPFNSAWSVETKAFMTSQNLKALFFSEDWVFISVDAYAQPISSLPLQVIRKTTEDNQSVEKPVQFHPVSQLLENPNPYVDGVALKYSLACDYVLGGNSFLYHAKQTKQCYQISFDRVQYKLDGQGLPEHYIVYPDNEEIIPNVTKGITISLQDMVHVRRPNPSSPLWGLSPFIPGRRSVLFNRYSQDYLNSFYLKGATPQGILEMEQSANEQSVLRLLRSFEMAHTGRRNQRRTMLLPKGVKWSSADHKIADQQITELVRMNRETILNTLHIPKHVVSLQEAGSLGSEEHKMALKYFWSAALLPTANAIAASLTKHFRRAGMLAINEEIRFDTSEVAVLQDDLKANAETANMLLSTHTLNEVRASIFGLPALEGGDATPGQTEPMLPFLPSAEIGATPEATPEQDVISPDSQTNISKISLNGAQVSSLVEVVQSVAAGTLPRESGVAIIQMAFQLTKEQAEEVMGSVGDGFVPAEPIEEVKSSDVDDGKDLLLKAVPEKYSQIDFEPPQDVADEAALGLEWREKYGRGGTEVGIARAVQLKNRRTVSPDTIVRMVSYFARHDGEGDNKEPNGEPSAGAIAWKLWGGDPGKRWSEKVKGQMEAADGKSQQVAPAPQIDGEVKSKELGKYAAQVKANEDSLDAYLKKELPDTTANVVDFLAAQTAAAIKALRSGKGIKADMPSAKEYKKRLEKMLKALEKEYMTKVNEPLSAAMDLGYDLQTQVVFDKPSRDALVAAKQTDAKGRSAALKARGIETFENVSKTTTDRIMNIVQAGIEKGASIDDVATTIMDSSKLIEPSRAMTIARTEMLTAVSLGQASMMNLAAQAIPGLKKAWVTAQDEDVRESHKRLNGEIREHDEKFSNGLMYPRDPDGEPGDSINCRCTLVTLPPEDLEDYRAELQALKETAE